VERSVCVHGHFYQPPREHPWLEIVELTDEAYPFHDWNERITAECYQPNTRARILDEQGRIQRIVNNYARISFNVGPTLLAWMRRRRRTPTPASWTPIAAAARYGGHGSALAQVYNHAIMPLANERDRRTRCGGASATSVYRFGREPEGMWLAETAVDDATLDLLAEHGIRFTILSPYQAARTRRRIGETSWHDVHGGRVDPTMPYRVALPSGRSIAVFFYDGPISQGGRLRGPARLRQTVRAPAARGLQRPARAAARQHRDRRRVLRAPPSTRGDGARGDAPSAVGTATTSSSPTTRSTSRPTPDPRGPGHPGELVELRARGRALALGLRLRWRSGTAPALAGPAAGALDYLRDELAAATRMAAPLLADPWAARDDYIEVILDRDPERIESFLEDHATRELDAVEQRRAIQLLEMQRHAMLMFTSCGWFFDELSRPEPLQVLRYAARAIQLARVALGSTRSWSAAGRPRGGVRRAPLAPRRATTRRYGDGRGIYEQRVRPAIVDLEQVGAHFAISSLS
jgi:hypothetical protein